MRFQVIVLSDFPEIRLLALNLQIVLLVLEHLGVSYSLSVNLFSKLSEIGLETTILCR